MRLFLARAAAVRPGVGGQPGELDAVAAICVALDGLPLAIELAAARVRLYTPQALLPLLRSRLALLTGGPRDLPRRQQTLHAALDWSYQLLPAAGRQLFGCLGVFAGPFDAAAAAAVSGGQDPAAILEQLAALAEQSMVEITHGTVPLFHLLQTVTEYALARLAEDGCLDEARRRHLEYYLALAESARDQYSGARQSAVLDLLEAAQPNIRAALEFACGQAGQDGQDGGCLDQGLRLATAAGILWRRRGPLAEGELEFGRLLARSDRRGSRADPRVHAAAVLEACILACLSGEYSRTHELSRQGIRLCGELGDQHGLIWAHHLAGEAALAAGDFGSAQEHLEEALALARQAGDLGDLAAASNMVGQLYRMTGRGDEAGRLLRQAVRLFRDAGDPDGAAAALHSLAETERVAGHTSLARRLHARSLRQHDAVGDKRGAAYCLEGMAALAAHAGDTRQALVYLAAAQVLREQIGAPLPPVDEASLAAILAPGLAAMTTRQQRDALAEGRNQPLADTIGSALRG